MLQYAAGRGLALRCGAELKIDLSAFDAYMRRRYELGVLPICAAAATEPDLAGFGVDLTPRSGFIERVRRCVSIPGRSRNGLVYREPHFHFDPTTMSLQPPIYLDGYWQSERYFLDYADTVRRELTPTDPSDDENAAVSAQSMHRTRWRYMSAAATMSVT